MKPLAGTFLLLFPLIMTGCGKQNPAGAGPKPAPTVLVPEGLNERHAANFLSGAKGLQKDGESEQAIEVLNELLTLYPKSDAADEARKLLSDLKKRSLGVGAAAGDHDPGEIVTVRGLLTHFPQDVKSIEAWLGHEFMVGETPIRTTDKVPRDFLITMVGQNVEIEGIWNAGKESKPPKPADEEYELQTPSYPEGQTIVREAGIEASAVKKVEE
jgi:hypothetical protein